MNTNQIACFLQAARCLSFTEAADALFLSPQAVSKQIGALEADLSTRLFERNGPHLRLTANGEMYEKLFEGRERQLSFLREDVRLHRKSLHLELRIGISEWVDPAGEFGRGLASFRAKCPNCRTSVGVYANAGLMNALKEGRLDCAFFSGAQRPQHRNLCSRAVAREEMQLYTPSDLGEGPARQDCWGLPLLLVPAWSWTYTELKVVGAREVVGASLFPVRTKILPNLPSMYAEMEFSRCSTLGGGRFNYFMKVPGLTGHPIGHTDDIYCLWERENENPLMKVLTDTLRAFFAYPGEEEE